MIILGIDPSLKNTGWGLIDFHNNKLSFIACGCIVTKASDAIINRLYQTHNTLSEVIYNYQPHEVAMEESFVNKNPSSSLKLAQARGSIILSIALAQLPLTEYAATLVKKSVTGVGRAEKHQVIAMVNLLLPTAKVDNEHAADALAVAICHSSFIRNKHDR
jgi:crossover junction endodeoxyribonuclease RuvC